MNIITPIVFSLIINSLQLLDPIQMNINFLGVHDTFISVGSNEKIVSFSFNQEITYTWLMQSSYSPKQSNKSHLIGEAVNGTIYSDDFVFIKNSIQLVDFPYLLSGFNLVTNSFHTTAGFGLAYSFPDNKMSLIHNLHSKGLINHLAYSFIQINDTSSSLIFGGIPELSRNKLQSGKCHIIPNQSKWFIHLKAVNIKGFNYFNNLKAHFQIGIDKVYAPQHFINYVIDVIYKDAIATNQCQPFWRRYVSCKPDYISQNYSISFTIDDHSFSLTSSELFEEKSYKRYQSNDNYSDSLLILNPFDENTWVFGNFFLKRFDVLFDMENGLVELFCDEKRIKDVVNFWGERMCCFGVYLISAFGLVLLGHFKYVTFSKVF